MLVIPPKSCIKTKNKSDHQYRLLFNPLGDNQLDGQFIFMKEMRISVQELFLYR